MKIGLVLAGGGARGAYHIGVWKAFRELGIDNKIDIISGTSIGALNGVLFLNNDFKLAEDIWLNITTEKVLPIKNYDLSVRKFFLGIGLKRLEFIKKYTPGIICGGDVSRIGIEELINKVDFERIINNHKKIYVTCTELSKMKAEYFNLKEFKRKEIIKILLATSAIPMIFPIEKIGSGKYLDGGIIDNVPIEAIRREKCDLIIVAHLGKETIIDKSKFYNTKIIELRPSKLENGNEIKSTLNFNKRLCRKRIDLGYRETMDMFLGVELLRENKNILKKIKNMLTSKN